MQETQTVDPRAVLGQVTRALRVYVEAQRAQNGLGAVLASDADREAWRQKVKRVRMARLESLQASLRRDLEPEPTASMRAPEPSTPIQSAAPTPAQNPVDAGEPTSKSSPNLRFNSGSAATGGIPDAIKTEGPAPWKTVGSRPKRARVTRTMVEGPAKIARQSPASVEEPPPFDPGDMPPMMDDAPPIGEMPEYMQVGPPIGMLVEQTSNALVQKKPAAKAARHDVPEKPPVANRATTPQMQEEVKVSDEQVPLAGGAWTKPEHALKGYDDSPELEKRIDQMSKDEKLMFLRQCLGDCERCNLSKTRTNIVFGDGSARAEIVFVGEGPGYHEDKQGIPFVGESGQLLNKMIRAMGLHREDIYIANVVKCRPPKNRDPAPDEILQCSPFLYKQLETIEPKVIITLGRFATQCLLDTKRSMGSMRGRWHKWREVDVMPTYHPAYLLRSPQKKRDAWADLQQVMEKLGLPRE